MRWGSHIQRIEEVEMSTSQNDLEMLEKRIFEERSRDGIFEIMLGLLFLAVASLVYTDHMGLVGAISAMPAILIPILRHRFVDPRLGVVKPAGKRALWMTSARSMTIIMIAGLVLLGLVAAFSLLPVLREEPVRSFLQRVDLDLFFLMMFAVFAMIGVIYGYRHVGIYLAGGAVIAIVRTLFLLPKETSFVLAGTLLLLLGISNLTRFLRRYPLIPDSNSVEGE